MPGIGLEIDGAMQHAPHPGRHATAALDAGAWMAIANVGKGRMTPLSRARDARRLPA